MARATLGDFLDIHTGGIDHIPVHHTNEIAQSECGFTNGKKWVNYRVHCQFLNIDSAKISKSLGNVFSLPDIQAKGFNTLDLRYFYMQAHYRSFQDFTREALEAAKAGRKGLQKKIRDILQPVIASPQDVAIFSS
jgi:cysteinyl-tRNA synthetase